MINNNDSSNSSDQIVVTMTKDKMLTYSLIVLIIATVVVGYSMISSKNQVKADNKQVAAADPMADHHGGSGAASNKKFVPLTPGTVAPDFSLVSTNGQTVSLADYKGRNVLLFFNEGVMCSPCWQEVSRLERFKDDFAKLNTVIIPISVDDQKTWDPILKEERITTPILIDAERKVSKAYKILGTPSSMHDDRPGHTYVHIDLQGKIHASSDFPNMNVPTNVLLQHIQEFNNGKSQG